MKSVLYELYHDNIDASSLYEPLLKEHRNFLRRKFDETDALKEKLDEEENEKLTEAFDKIVNLAYIDARWDTSNAFMQGFSLGARIMAEAYCLNISAKDD